MSIGDNIKQIRKEKKLTQQRLAKEIGISRSYLSDVENNRYNPSSKTIESLSGKLGVTMLYLTTGKKALADLTNEEKKESVQKVGDIFEQYNEIIKDDVKNDIKQLLDTELSFVETMYIENMLRFLRTSDPQDITGVASIISTLNRVVVYKNADDADKDELNEFLKNELDDITKFFHDYFFKVNKEGD